MQYKDIKNYVSNDDEALAMILFGSRARGDNSGDSDFDICVVLFRSENGYSNIELSKKKLEYLSNFDYDIAIFQQLPLYIQHRVLKEGKVIYTKDSEKLYDLSFRTAKGYEKFKHIYEGYLREVQSG